MDEEPVDSKADSRKASARGWPLRWPAGLTVSAILIIVLTSILTPLGERLTDLLLSSPDDSDVPFTVVVKESNNLCVDGWIAKPSAPFPTSDADDQSSWDGWAAKHGATPAASTIDLTIQGRSNATVVLQGFRVRILQRRPPIEGIYYHKGCGDREPVRHMKTDLDAQPPVVTTEYVAEYDDQKVGPITFPYSVNDSDVEIFELKARTASCDCDWVIDLEWTSEGRHGVYTVSRGGAPFRTSGSSRVIDHCRDDGGSQFYCGEQ